MRLVDEIHQLPEIGALHCNAHSERHPGFSGRANALAHLREGVHAADRGVSRGVGRIERDRYGIEELRDAPRVLRKRQTGGQQPQFQAPITQQRGDLAPLWVEQGLASGNQGDLRPESLELR